MACRLATLLAAGLTIAAAAAATAQETKHVPKQEPKHGGILRMYHRETPGGISIHEEATFSTNVPMMGVFSNLVIYDQHKPQNSMDTIVPELATSWSWSADKTQLTFKLRQGVKWHDGQPFTAKDVKCTWDMLRGVSEQKFRKNPRKDWYANVTGITVNGDSEATFQLKRPQPSLLAMLASGYSPVYPCHVPPAQMRTHPIGTGPYKFVEMKQNESIKLVKNPDYWKTGPALSRRHRIHHHSQSLDRRARLRHRQSRHDLPDGAFRRADEGHQGAGAERDLRPGADQCQHQPDHQPRRAAVRQRGSAHRHDAGARPPGLRQDPVRGTGRHRWLAAAAARRRLGPAGRYPEDDSRLRRRRAEESRRGAQDHGRSSATGPASRSR